MLKFYIESVIQHPLTGEADRKIIEVVAEVPELEKVLFCCKRIDRGGEDRRILDVMRMEADNE